MDLIRSYLTTVDGKVNGDDQQKKIKAIWALEVCLRIENDEIDL